MIKTVMRWPNDMVMVFDASSEQLPEYQGQYEVVKQRILEDAPEATIFAHGIAASGELQRVSREEW